MATARKKASSKKSTTKRKSSAAKASSKKTTKKTVVASTPAKTVSRFDLLKRFHLFSAAVSASVAVLAVILLNNQTIDLTTTYSAADPIAGEGQAVLGTAYDSLLSVEFRYVVAALFTVAAVLSLLLATKLRDRYEAGVKNATSFYRWLFAGFVFALLVESITALAGVQDFVTLKLVAGLAVTTTLLGYLAERTNKGTGTPHWGAYGLSLFTGFLAWLPAAVTIVGTHIYGEETYGWHVYALAAVVLAVCVRVATTQYRFIKHPSQHKDYVLVEERYLSNELLAKLAFAAIVFIALID